VITTKPFSCLPEKLEEGLQSRSVRKMFAAFIAALK